MALITCNLCGHQISSRARFCPKCRCPNIAIVQGMAEAGSNGESPPRPEVMSGRSDHLLARINCLELIAPLKAQFELIATTEIKKTVLGIPQFDSDDQRLKYRFARGAGNAMVSWSGFCSGPGYYFTRGMWRKGSVMTLLIVVALCSGLMIGGGVLLPLVSTAVLMVLSAFMATYDRYRHLVLGEKFWW